MMDALKHDQEARRVACSEFDHPVVLRAGAGTGKTATLVARVVVWATTVGWNRIAPLFDSDARAAQRVMSGIVAITFTEAAAAEMAERVADALHGVARGKGVQGLPGNALDPKARERAHHLLKALDHLKVRTIHAYCRGLLAKFPIEAKLHPSFELDAAGDAVTDTVREVVEEHLTNWLTTDPSAVIDLFARGVTPADIEDATRTLVLAGVTEENLASDPFGQETVDAWLVQTRNAIHATLSQIAGAFSGLRAGNATKLLAGLEACRDGLVGGMSIGDAQALVARTVPPNLLAHLAKAWGRGDAGKAESEAFALCGEAFPEASRSTWHRLSCLIGVDEAAYRLSVSVVEPILRCVHRRLHAQGAVVFNELLKRASKLVKNASVARAVTADMDQLLVDEFQDTDRVQCDLVRHLALRGPISGRPGLFLVGDPKQSIYGWRSADLRAYEGFVAEVLEAGGSEHGLVQNFRSTQPILREVDAVMSDLMRPVEGVQPAYESLVSARGEGDRGDPVCMWVAWDVADGRVNPDTGVSRGREIEAEALALDLSRLRGQGCDLAEVGVLFRSMTDIGVYQRALRAHGIPHEVTKDRNYFRRREVVEAAALVRAVLDPFDTLGFLGFIRSAAIQVPAEALIPLWIAELPRLWAELGSVGSVERASGAIHRAVESLEENVVQTTRQLPLWALRLLDAAVKVDQLRTDFEVTPFDEWLGRLREELVPEVYASTAYQAEYRVANLELFFRNLTNVMEATGGDTTALLRSLREAVSRQQEAEEARPNSREGVVRLMTIHKSKGLAFEHTYIMDLHHGLRPTSRPTGTAVDDAWGIQLFGFWPLGFDAVWRRSEVVTQAERIRLVYVAMTRARDRLVLSGTWPTVMRGPHRAKMLADLWANRAPSLPCIASLADTASTDGVVQSSGLTWHLLGLANNGLNPNRRSNDETIQRGEVIGPEALIKAKNRMNRPLLKGPSSAASLANPEPRISGGGGGRVTARDSMVIGTIVHRMFEDFPRHGAIDTGTLTERFQRASTSVCGAVPISAAAVRRGRQLVSSLGRGRLVGRFQQLEIVGMEVPMLLHSDTADGPLVGWSGTIDMVCRDRTNGPLRVVDFKTTALKGRTLQAVAQTYAHQGRVYVDGVKKALSLEVAPKFEVWFVEADDWVEVPLD